MSDPALRIAEVLRQNQKFLILTHYRPDGDALGSQLAVALLLKDLGKDVTVWNDDPVPAKFVFLPHSHLVQHPPAEPQEFDVVIAVDTASWQRAGVATKRIKAHKHFINIDHHVSNEKFAEINWIVPTSPATGQIIFQLVKAGGFTLTSEIATCLFAAISTDTGSFAYSNTTAECLNVAAELVQAGVNVGELSRHIYESYPYARLQLLQRALADLTLADRNRIAYYWITNEMYQQTGAKREDTEGLIDYARAIEGVVVAVLFEELANAEAGKIRISIRSKNAKLDANSIARQFGGGGHREAAGARLTGEPHAVEHQVVGVISKALQEAGL
jgi:phosphoesterase RecJ-like protein